MSLDLLTSADAVHAAMDEFDTLGRRRFLRRHGYRASQRYFAVRAGKRYDAKAIAGVAVGYVDDARAPLAPVDFTGGQGVHAKLASLGIETLFKRRRTHGPPTT